MPNSLKSKAIRDAEVYGPDVHTALDPTSAAYLANREKIVRRYYGSAIGIDTFMTRAEMELFKHGFTPDNTIAVLNLCRDEICNSLKKHVEAVYGPPFNIHGLGGVLTCGMTGIGAGLSHAPKPANGGRLKYVFFSFPHIAINSAGEVGEISRKDCDDSHACGAMLKVLGQVKKEAESNTFGKEVPFNNLDPEYSILKARMDRKIAKSAKSPKDLDLVSLTALGEEGITEDLEELIAKVVDPAKADYAVITGIQIHNWARSFEDDEPCLEFIQPGSTYVVINGKKSKFDAAAAGGLTPRMMSLLMQKKSNL